MRAELSPSTCLAPWTTRPPETPVGQWPDSALVRASFFGGDPNWGRLLGALGASDVPFDPGAFAVSYEGVSVAADGVAVAYPTGVVLDAMDSGDLSVEVTIGDGPGRRHCSYCGSHA